MTRAQALASLGINPDTGHACTVSRDYRVRFVSQKQGAELVNLYHLARTALSGLDDSRYQRKLWAARQFHVEHPEISETAAYKDLDGLLS